MADIRNIREFNDSRGNLAVERRANDDTTNALNDGVSLLDFANAVAAVNLRPNSNGGSFPGMQRSLRGIAPPLLGMIGPFLGITLSLRGIAPSFQGMTLRFLGMTSPSLGITPSFLGITPSFLGMEAPFLGMKAHSQVGNGAVLRGSGSVTGLISST